MAQGGMQVFPKPIHADVLFAMYYLGLWSEVEKLKRGFAELAPTYDFTRYSQLIEERTGPVVYWPEAFHFSALGELVARAMTGLRTADMPGNFGVVLDAKKYRSEPGRLARRARRLDCPTPRPSGAKSESGSRLSKRGFLQGRPMRK